MLTLRKAPLAAVILAIALFSGSAQAGTIRTWNGLGVDANWTTPANWGGTAPVAGDLLVFDGSTQLANTNNFAAGTSFASITFAPGAGTFVLSGNALTLSGGASAIANNSGVVQNINLPITFSTAAPTVASVAASTLNLNGTINLSTFTLTAAADGPMNFTNSITGTGNLSKTGAGTLTLSGLSATATSNYSGATTIDLGTIAITTTNPTFTGGFNFGLADGSTNLSTLDLTNASATFNGLMLVRTNSAGVNSLLIGTGRTLSLAGGLTMGFNSATAATTTNLTVSGAGAMAVTGGSVQVGFSQTTINSTNNSVGTLDLSGLTGAAGFSANVTNFNVGQGNTSSGVVTLTNTSNTIAATTMNIGNSNSNNGGPVTCVLTLGTGANVLNADTINVGISKLSGTITFASQTPGSQGTLAINNKAGSGASNITLGSNAGTATAAVFTGLLELRGHNSTVSAGSLSLGIGSNTGSGSTTGTLNFDTGTFTATTLNIGAKSGAAGGGTATGNVNVSGGTFTVNSGGSMVLAANTNDVGSGVGNLNITGGVFTSNVAITKANQSRATSTITLNGGILDMAGNSIGTNTNTVVLNAQTGTLRNLGQFNTGGTFTKSIAGTLNLTGTNSYTGTFAINAGTVLIGSSSALSSAGTLSFAGTSILDLNGFDSSITNISASVATATITDSSAAAGTTTLTISGLGATISCLVLDGTPRGLALRIANNNLGASLFANNANTFSGGLTLLHNAAGGTRLTVGTITSTGTAGAIISSPYGRGPIRIGQIATDKAGIYFNTAAQTILNDIVFNTTLGTDRVGIRSDVTGCVLSGTITANVAATFSTNGTGVVALNGQMTGVGGLVLDNAFGTSITVNLNNATANANNFTGGVSIFGANNVLGLSRADQIPNGPGFGDVLCNGRINLNGFNETINGFSGSATGSVDAITGTPILTVGDNNAPSSTFSGSLRNTAPGVLSITKINSGTLTLDGASTYTGVTTVNAGILKSGIASVGATGAFGNSIVTLANTAGVSLDITGFDTQIAGLNGGGPVNGNVTLGAATLSINGGATATTYAGVISGSGGLTLNGIGSQTLLFDQQYAGLTNIAGGSLVLDGSTASIPGNVVVGQNASLVINDAGTNPAKDRIPDTATVTLNGGNFTLAAPAGINRTETVGALTFSGDSSITLNATNSNAQLNIASLARVGGAGALTLTRNFTTGQSNLFVAPGAGDPAEPAEGSAVAFVQVNDPSRSGPGYYSRATDVTSGVTANLPGSGNVFTFTSVATGNWDAPSTWARTGNGIGNPTTPSAADYVLISANHTINLNGADRSALAVNFAPNALNQTSSIVGANTLTVASGAVSVNPGNAAIGTGLRGDYYNSTNFNFGPLLTRIENINQPNGTIDPDSTGPLSTANFSIVWTGFVQPDFSENYTFGVASDDGFRLYVNNQLIAESWTPQALGAPVTGSIPLVAGTKYPIRVEYYQGGTNNGWLLSWASTSQTTGVQTIVPATNLYPTSSPISIGCNLNFGAVPGVINNASSSQLTFSGAVQGSAGIDILSNAAVAFTGANTFTGGTRVHSGLLQVGSDTALSSGAVLMDAKTGIGGILGTAVQTLNIPNTIQANGDFFVYNSGLNLNFAGPIELLGNRTVSFMNNTFALNPGIGAVTLSGGITDGGNNFNFTKGGSGGVTITGTALTHGGTTTLARGQVNLGASNMLRTDRAVILNGSATVALLGATLNLNGFDQTLPGLSITAGSANNVVTTSVGASTLTLNVPTGTSTYAGLITGAVTLTKTGGGTFALGGGNTYFNATNVQGGTLQLAANNVIPDASIVTIDTGASLNTGTFGDTIGAPGRLVFNGGTLAGTGTMAIGANAGDDIVVTAAGGTITAPISFAGTREVNVVAGGLLNIDAAISGAGGLTKIGAGTVLLQRVNPYTGATTVNEGVLQLNGNVATIVASTPINLNGGTFFIDGTTGGAVLNRIGDAVPVNFNGGTFSMAAASDTSRLETVGTATFSGSNSTITLTPTGTSTSQLTLTTAAATPARTAGATFNFVKPAATPGLATLYYSGGVNGTTDVYATVNGNPSIYNGAGTGGSGLIETTITTVITDSDGDWGTSNTAFPGDTLPPAGSHIIIRHAVTVSAAVSAASITYDLQVGGTPSLNAATPQTVTVTSGKVATSGTVAPVINSNITTAFGAVAGVLQSNSSGLFTINGPITGSAGLAKTGTGTVLLTNTGSTYTGTNSILAGTLSVTADTSTASDGILGVSANGVSLFGGTFRANGTFTTARTFTVANASASNAIDVASGQTLTLTTALAGNNALLVNANPLLAGALGGSLSLPTASARTGATTLNGGTVLLASTTGNTGFGTGAVTINEASLEYASTGAANERLSNALTLNDKATLRGTGTMATTSFTSNTLFIAPGAKVNFQTGATATDVFRLFDAASRLSGGGSGSTITISGAGRVQFMQDNANQQYRGDYIINSGLFAVNNANSLSHTANVVTINPTGTFSTNLAAAGTVSNPFVLNGGTLGVNAFAITWSGNVAVNASSSLSTSGLGGGGQTVTVSGILSGSSPLAIVGSGATVFLTNPANTFSGNLILNTGASIVNPPATTYTNTAVLQLQPVNSPPVSGPPATVVFGGNGAGVLNLRSDVGTVFSTSVLLNAANGTINVDRPSLGTAQTLSLSTLTLTNDTLNVTGGNSYGLLFSGTTFAGTGSSAKFNPTTAPLTLSGAITESAAAGNSFTLNSTATNSVTFSGSVANTYTGATTINGGTLILNKTPGVNAIAANVAVGDGTGADTLRLLAANQIADTSTLTSNVVSGRIELNGSETIASIADAGTGAVASQLLTGATAGGVLTVGASNTSTTYSGAISQAGGITKVGTGTLTLAGANSYTGTLTITDGAIQAGSGSALGTGGLVMSGGLLNLNTFSPTVSSLAGTAGTITDNAAGAGTATLLVNQAVTTVFNGVIQDGATRSLALVKNGVGSLTLGSANTYSFSTSINAGALLTANATGSATGTSPIAVAAAGTLGGTGSVVGPVGVAGSIAPGIGGVGTFTVASNVIFNAGSSLAVDILNATSDQLAVNGSVSLAANVALNVTATTPVHGTVFNILAKSGATPVTGTFNGLLENTQLTFSGNPFIIRYVSGDGNDIVLVSNTIPAFTAAPTNTTQSVDELQPLSAMLATDADSDTLTYALFSGTLPTGVTLAADGSFTGVPAAGTAGNYTVVVQITDPTGSFVRTTLGITVTGVTLTINSVVVAEAAGSVDVTVTRSGLGNQVVTVQATTANGNATAGQDYTAVTVPVTFPIGVFTQIVTIPILDDITAEPLETFTVGLSSAVNASITAPGSGTVTIIDDETPPTLVITGADVSEAVGSATITVTLTGAAAQNITVNYNAVNLVATAGADFVATAGVLTWFPGETGAKTFNVPIINDLIDENDEPFTVALSNVSANASIVQATATVIIRDNDLPPLAVADSIVTGQGVPKTVAVLTNDTGLANLPVRVTIFFGAANGVTLVNADNTVTYTPNPSFSGIDSFIYRVTDAANQTTNATVTVDVRPSPTFSSLPTLTPNPALAGQLITGTAAFTAGSITWNWGDGSPLETTASVSHIYPEPGVYTVGTTLTSPEGVQNVIQTQVFIGLGFGDGTGGGTGGGANPPGVSGILVGVGGAGKLQGGTGKLSLSYTSPARTTFSGSLGQLGIPATVTQTGLSGQAGKLVVGTGVTAAQFTFTLGKTGKAKSTGLTSFEFSVKKKRLKFSVRRGDLNAIFESLGATRQSPVDKTKVINLLVPVTVQVGDKIFVAMTFALKYKQSSTSSGKGAL